VDQPIFCTVFLHCKNIPFIKHEEGQDALAYAVQNKKTVFVRNRENVSENGFIWNWKKLSKPNWSILSSRSS
jgi:hypothetical protein